MTTSFAVTKLASAAGHLLWRHDGNGNFASGYAITVDGSNNAVAAGTLGPDFAVVKLASSNGAVLWNGALGGTDGTANAVALDSAGNVLAAGHMDGGVTQEDFAVVKLAGTGGGKLWRHTIAGAYTSEYLYDNAASVAVTAATDAVAAGWLADSPDTIDFTIVKLAASDGHELWRTQLNSLADKFNEAYGVGIDGAADVLAAGVLGGKLVVVKRSGADGSAMWTTTVPGADEGYGAALAVTPGGDVVVAGLVDTRFAIASGAGVCGPKDGWKTSGSGTATYENKSNAIDPPACSSGSAKGLVQFRLRDQRSKRGEIGFSVKMKKSIFVAPVGPLRITIGVSSDLADGQQGACGTVTFAPWQCVLHGTKLDCR